MSVSFLFKEEQSPILGKIRRPIADVHFRHATRPLWQPVVMIIDTGADYTLLPLFLASVLGVNVKRDCRRINTQGVGGTSVVFFLNHRTPVKIGSYERTIPFGFLSHDYLPPLLGRHEFLETFRVLFEDFQTTFS